jgi:hypothetical protein
MLRYQVKAAIQPLYDLLTRFAPDLSYLTTIHPIFVTVSIQCLLWVQRTVFH